MVSFLNEDLERNEDKSLEYYQSKVQKYNPVEYELIEETYDSFVIRRIIRNFRTIFRVLLDL
jgi:hypothetical protein